MSLEEGTLPRHNRRWRGIRQRDGPGPHCLLQLRGAALSPSAASAPSPPPAGVLDMAGRFCAALQRMTVSESAAGSRFIYLPASLLTGPLAKRPLGTQTDFKTIQIINI